MSKINDDNDGDDTSIASSISAQIIGLIIIIGLMQVLLRRSAQAICYTVMAHYR